MELTIMELTIVALASLVVTIILSIVIGNMLYKRRIAKNENDAEEKAKLIVREAELQAENIKKDRILEAKEKFLKMKQEFDEDTNRKKNQVIANEQKIKQRETQLAKELE